MWFVFVLTFFLGQTAPVGIIKTSEIKPGMKGYGLTVFSGEEPVKFDIEVIGVMRRAMIDQDLILVRCKHPVLEHTGVIAGMSGSPIYINGKFAGGLGYGYQFAKDPIALITPAEDIVRTMQRPVQNIDVWGRTTMTSADNWTTHVRNSIVAVSKPLIRTEATVMPLSMSLSVSGVPVDRFADFFPMLTALGPTAPAGTSEGLVTSKAYTPGAPVAVWLVSGDINVAAIGTVTHVEGDRVAVFAHPFLSMGEMRLPTGNAFIHTVIARQSNSMKIGTLTAARGALIRDEQPAVVLDQSAQPGFLPVTVTVVPPGENEKTYHFKVARHRTISPNLVFGLVRLSINRLAQHATDFTFTVDHEFQMEGMTPIRFTDSFSSMDGLHLGFPGGWNSWGSVPRGEIALHLLLNNPFARLALSRVNVRVHVARGLNLYQIQKVETTPIAFADREFALKIKLKPLVGAEIEKNVRIKLPRSFASHRVFLEVSAGRDTPIDAAQPRDINGLLDFIQKSMDAHSLVVTVRSPAPQLDMEGMLISDVPLSVLDTLVRRGLSTPPRVEQTLYRQVVRFPEVLAGVARCQLVIKDPTQQLK